MSKRIVVVGANGFIGRTVLQHLHAAGHQVTACVRTPDRFRSPHPAIRVVAADYTTHTTAQQWAPLLQGADVVVNAVGIIRERGDNRFAQIHTHGPIALFDAAAAVKVKQVIQISALGSDAMAQTPFHLSKRAADDYLAASDCDWLILRPSLVYGNGGKSAEFFQALASLPLIPVAGRGEQPVQPVAVEDLATIVLSFVAGAIRPRQRLDVVGAKPLTIREMLTLYRQWLGLGTPRFLPVPERWALWLAHRLGLFGIAPPGAETLAMLRRGNTADAAHLFAQSGVATLPMDEALMRTPVQQRERRQARLYFLHPLLRISLGLMWIWTALVSAGLYPIDKSLALLAEVGITGTQGVITLLGATLLDLLLGLALLVRRRVKTVAWLQIGVITVYSLIITVALPDYWFHPFGPLSKNLPLIVATMILIAMEE